MNETESKIVKFSLADLSKVMKASKLSETPFFFSVTVQDKVYMLAAGSEELRSSWIKSIRGLSVRIFILLLNLKYLVYAALLFLSREPEINEQTHGYPQGSW